MLEGFEFRVMRADRRRVETLRVTVPLGGIGTASENLAATDASG
jgi:Mg2+/Co2+ transporter CorC